MTIYIDADACPVTRIAEDIARRRGRKNEIKRIFS